MPEKRNNFETMTHPVPAEPLFLLLDYFYYLLCMNSDIFVEHALYVAKIQFDTILNPGLMALRLVQLAQL